LPQGLSKKIQFQLLLADLALQRRDPLLSRPRPWFARRIASAALARSTRRSKAIRTLTLSRSPPQVQRPPINPELRRQSRHPLALLHAGNRRKLTRLIQVSGMLPHQFLLREL
jgi:hypothetical protein